VLLAGATIALVLLARRQKRKSHKSADVTKSNAIELQSPGVERADTPAYVAMPPGTKAQHMSYDIEKNLASTNGTWEITSDSLVFQNELGRGSKCRSKLNSSYFFQRLWYCLQRNMEIDTRYCLNTAES
jgi:hypothetical protein